jgi:acetyl esterase/lipase
MLATVAVLALSVLAAPPVTPAPPSPGPEDAGRPPEPQAHTYRTVGNRGLSAHVFRPAGGGRRPAVVLFHGGGWRIGEPAWLFERARELAAKGMVAVAVEYRLSNEGLSPADAVEDACAAFAWTRANAERFGVDVARVAGYGVSAGGHLAAAAATLPSVKGRPVAADERPNALLLFSPALDMAKDEYFGGLMAGKGDPALYSPAQFVGPKLPPTLVIQGEEDTIVLTPHARAFCETARRAGATCELHVYPKVGHLLTRNLKVQYRDFDQDPAAGADAHAREDAFLAGLGYARE